MSQQPAVIFETQSLNRMGWGEWALGLIGLPVFAAFLHSPLTNAPLAFTNADFAHFSIEGARFFHGDWIAFAHSQDYGGMILAPFRLLWISLFVFLGWAQGPMDPIIHYTFNFCIQPAMMTMATWFLLRSYYSSVCAFLVSIGAAIGFPYWTTHLGNDFYIAYYILGCLLLALRRPYLNPLMQASNRRLLALGLLSGLAVYTSRASLLFVVVAWWPLQLSLRSMICWIRPRTLNERTLYRVAGVLFFLFLYLEFFGPHLGQFNGVPVKLHAQPNLQFALLILGLVALRKIWEIKSQSKIQEGFHRLSFALTGGALGFLPEIFYWIGKRQWPPAGTGSSNSPKDMAMVLGDLPHTLQTLIGSPPQILAHASIALTLFGVVLVWKNRNAQRHLNGALLLGGLAIFAFCRVHTYALAPERYLFPIYPAVVLFIGMAIQQGFDWMPKRPALAALLAALWIGHTLGHFNSKQILLVQAIESREDLEAEQILSHFKKIGVRLVYTDDYWRSNQYTLHSGGEVVFFSKSGLRPWIAQRAFDELGSDPHLTGWLSADQHAASERTVQIGDRSYPIEKFARVGRVNLYRARAGEIEDR